MLGNNNFPMEQMQCSRMRWGLDILIPIVLVPALMLLASQGWLWTLGVFSVATILIIGFYFRNLRRKRRNRFFLSWAITSYFFLLAVFQLEVVPFLEILFVENLILMSFVAVMTLCAYVVRRRAALELPVLKGVDLRHKNVEEEWPLCEICRCSRPPKSKHCKICGYCILQQDHHCLWLDSCIGMQNRRYYRISLVSLLASCWYYADLTLTTVCYPLLFRNMFLYPSDCSDVYGDVHVALCYVSAIYAIIIGFGAVVKLILHMWILCQNCKSKE